MRSTTPCTRKTSRAEADATDAGAVANLAGEVVVAVTAGDMGVAVGVVILAEVVEEEAAETPSTALATIATSLATKLLTVAKRKLTTRRKKQVKQK